MPAIGQTVFYTLSSVDAEHINRRRTDFTTSASAGTGFVGHIGNLASAGQQYPATVVRTFGGTAANLQVHLDGTDVLWATSRSEGDGDGLWSATPN